jgi:hypothetical protein
MSAESPELTSKANENRIARCRACDARIIFLKTSAGKNMPVDADTVRADDQVFDSARHVSHFSKCPKASEFRKPRR